MDDVPEEILRHYRRIDEGRRIREGLGELELLRTQEVIGRHLTGPTGRILDVGGATGVHAEWLAAQGHAVHVVDLLSHHIDEAALLPGVTAELADARALPMPDDSFDAVLLLGPLYHLSSRDDRLRAWSEARRVVRDGGLIFAGAISRFASLFDGLARGFLFDPAFREIVERDLSEGQHRNPDDRPHWFTTAYLHRPDELTEEAESSGLQVLELVGLEGLAGWLPHVASQWEDPRSREAILYSARAVESDAATVALSGHLLLVARDTA